MPDVNFKEPAAVLHDWIERVWNNGDELAIDQLLSPACVAHGLSAGPLVGPAAFKAFFQSFRAAFPDMRIDIERYLTEGALCAAHCKVIGTHKGDGLGFPATGKPVAIEGMVIFRIEGGQLQEGWNSFDFLSLYQQLGLIPAGIP